jgi:hypothetical protein
MSKASSIVQVIPANRILALMVDDATGLVVPVRQEVRHG